MPQPAAITNLMGVRIENDIDPEKLRARTSLAPIVRKPISRPSSYAPDRKHGFVYAMRYGDFVKIGYTRNLMQRWDALVKADLRRLGLGLGALTVYASASGGVPQENALHKLLEQFAVEDMREWFCWCEPVKRMIDAYMTPMDWDKALESTKTVRREQ